MAEIKPQSLSYVVYQALADVDMPATTHFTKFLHFAIKGYRALNLTGAMPSVKYVKIPVNQNTNTCLLPKDYVEYLRIGVDCHGIFINLDYNPELVLQDANYGLQCACDSEHITGCVNQICNVVMGGGNALAEFGGWGWAGEFGNNGWNYDTPNYGIGPGFYHGGYRINNQLGVIQFDSCLTPKVVYMEYTSNGIDMNGDAVIPQLAVPAINAYVHWERCRFSDDRVLKQQAQEFRKLYLIAKQDLEISIDAMTAYEWKDLIRLNTYMAVKT
jgi:hypothetical protein